MAQKYRLVKTDSNERQYSRSRIEPKSQPDAATDAAALEHVSKTQRQARFWKGFSLIIFAALVAAGIIFWMHSVSGSLAHIRHAQVQQSQASAQQQHKLTQIQSILQRMQQQLTALGRQMQTYFLKLLSAISHSH